MPTVELKYIPIRSLDQYKEYCKQLEKLLAKDEKTQADVDEIELLTILIQKWDKDNNTFEETDAVQVLEGLMEAQGLKSKDIANILDLSKGHVSEILSGKKELSKNSIRILAQHFDLPQEVFNPPQRNVHVPLARRVHA